MYKEDVLQSNAIPTTKLESSYQSYPHSAGMNERTESDSINRSSSLDLTQSKEADYKNPSSPCYSNLNNPETQFGSEIPYTIRSDDNVPSPIITTNITSQSILDTIAGSYRYLKRCVGNSLPRTLYPNDSPGQVNGKRDVGIAVQSMSLVLNGPHDADEKTPTVSSRLDLASRITEPPKICDIVSKQTDSDGRKEHMIDYRSRHPLLVNMLCSQVQANKQENDEMSNMESKENEISKNGTSLKVENHDSKVKSRRVFLEMTHEEPSEDGCALHSFGHSTVSKCTDLLRVISQHVMSITSIGKSYNMNKKNSVTRFPKPDSLMFSDSIFLGGRRGSDILKTVDSDSQIQSDDEIWRDDEELNFDDVGLRLSPSCHYSNLGTNDREYTNQTYQNQGMSFPVDKTPVESVRDNENDFVPGQETKRQSFSKLKAKMSIHDVLMQQYAKAEEAPSLRNNKFSKPSLDNILEQAAKTPENVGFISKISLHNLLKDKYAREKEKEPYSITNKMRIISRDKTPKQNTEIAGVIELCAKESIHDLLDNQFLIDKHRQSCTKSEMSKLSVRENQCRPIDRGQNTESPSAMELRLLMSKHGLLVQPYINEQEAQPSVRNETILPSSHCYIENLISADLGRIPDIEMIRPTKENEADSSTDYLNDRGNTDYCMKRQQDNSIFSTDEASTNNDDLFNSLTPNEMYEPLKCTNEDGTYDLRGHMLCDRMPQRDIPSMDTSELLPTSDSEPCSREMPIVIHRSTSGMNESNPYESAEDSIDESDSQLAFTIASSNLSSISNGAVSLQATPECVDISVGTLTDESMNDAMSSCLLRPDSSSSSNLDSNPQMALQTSICVEESIKTTREDVIDDSESPFSSSESILSSNSNCTPSLSHRPQPMTQSIPNKLSTMKEDQMDDSVTPLRRPRSTSRLASSRMQPVEHRLRSISESRDARMGNKISEDSFDESVSLFSSKKFSSRRAAVSDGSATETSEQCVGSVTEDLFNESGPLSNNSQAQSEETSAQLNSQTAPLEGSSSESADIHRETTSQERDVKLEQWGLIKFLLTGIFFKPSEIDLKLSEAHAHSTASLKDASSSHEENLDEGTKSSGNMPKLKEMLSIYSRGGNDDENESLLVTNAKSTPSLSIENELVSRKNADNRYFGRSVSFKHDRTELPWRRADALATPTAVTPANTHAKSPLQSSTEGIEEPEKNAEEATYVHVSEQDNESTEVVKQTEPSGNTAAKEDDSGTNENKKNTDEGGEDGASKENDTAETKLEKEKEEKEKEEKENKDKENEVKENEVKENEEKGNQEKKDEQETLAEAKRTSDSSVTPLSMESILPYMRLFFTPVMDEVMLDTLHAIRGDVGCELCPSRRNEDEAQVRVVPRQNGGERGDVENRRLSQDPGEGGEGKSQPQDKEEEDTENKSEGDTEGVDKDEYVSAEEENNDMTVAEKAINCYR